LRCDDPRQEGGKGDGRPDLLAQAHRVDVKKTLESAVANAENNHDLDVDNLVVAEAYVGKALVMKRFQPRARGRVGRIRSRFRT
jgi:ribosomal protein L22